MPAPMPFISSSGVTAGSVPGRTETRSVRPAAVTVRTYSRPDGVRLLVEDIRAGCRGEFLDVAGDRRRRYLLAGALAEPGHEVRPPGALHRLGRGEPHLRRLRVGL